jgi:surface antigen
MQHLYSNPEVAYVLGSIKKGLSQVDVAALSEEDKAQLLAEIQEALERSPTVLQALAEFRN